MKYVLKKQHDIRTTGIMYGAGHGGFEAIYIIGLGMISNIATALVINNGMTGQLYAGLDEATAATVAMQLELLCESSPYMFIIGFIERIFAITAQIAISVFMWLGVTKKKGIYILIPVLMHFGLDFITVIVNSYTNVAVTEIMVFVLSIAMIIFAVRTYMKNSEVPCNQNETACEKEECNE